MDRRGPFVFSGSLIAWTRISWPGFKQLGDALALLAAAATAAARDLHAREDDVVRVQEAVLVEADVHEGGLEAGQDVVDLALVDVSDDRAVALALYVELGNPPVVLFRVLVSLTATLRRGAVRAALRLQDRDSRFATVHRDEQLLSQGRFPSCRHKAFPAAVSRACACIDCRIPMAINVVSTDEPP